MRIGIIINYYDASRGGVERYAETLTRALLAGGHEVHLIALEGRDLPEGVAFHPVEAATFWSPVKTFSFAAGAARVLDREAGAWDAVLGLARTVRQDVYREGAGAYGALLRARSRDGRWRSGEVLARMNLRHAAQITMERRIFAAWRRNETRRYLFNSRRVRDEILDLHDVPPERMDVLHNPVDTARFDPLRWRPRREETRRAMGVPGEAYTVLFSGSGFNRKGLDLAVAAVARSSAEPWLVVAGRGDTGPYRSQAERLGAASRVVFVGLRSDIEAVYGACDALLAPTRYDAFSNATIEGLAMALPVITTVMNGASEIVTEGREGYVVDDAEDTAALARALDRLANDKEREELGRRARIRAEALNPRAHADGVVKVLEAAVMMGEPGGG